MVLRDFIVKSIVKRLTKIMVELIVAAVRIVLTMYIIVSLKID